MSPLIYTKYMRGSRNFCQRGSNSEKWLFYFMNDESNSFESDGDSKQEKVLLYRVSCFKANVRGGFSSFQPFSHFCLVT